MNTFARLARMCLDELESVSAVNAQGSRLGYGTYCLLHRFTLTDEILSIPVDE
ncbi:hypothetical protein R1CP_39025 (plasmid) [Rhodococcus opacus]|uniref:Uncharacterized protein n=1 Tax=Rhodococcus opacus TaxID=37919 RepID=A0A1B1KIB0_RHOOP|nr:hypothetical protein R1CP_38520 [Rhodococcus opacus]ANS32393.1 hypothetical protein R1CP_39025 [Rhodococcus opacus]